MGSLEDKTPCSASTARVGLQPPGSQQGPGITARTLQPGLYWEQRTGMRDPAPWEARPQPADRACQRAEGWELAFAQGRRWEASLVSPGAGPHWPQSPHQLKEQAISEGPQDPQALALVYLSEACGHTLVCPQDGASPGWCLCQPGGSAAVHVLQPSPF